MKLTPKEDKNLLYFITNIITADGLVTWGAKASTGMVLAYYAQNFLSPISFVKHVTGEYTPTVE